MIKLGVKKSPLKSTRPNPTLSVTSVKDSIKRANARNLPSGELEIEAGERTVCVGGEGDVGKYVVRRATEGDLGTPRRQPALHTPLTHIVSFK